MKLKEYAKLINTLAKRYPDVDVIYSCDDEGNAYSLVYYEPTPMIAEQDACGLSVKNADDELNKPNAVCIN